MNKSEEREIIGMAGSFPVYSNYGEGVTVKKIKDEDGRDAYEITVPMRPKIFGPGKTKKTIKYINTVGEYAQARACLIRKKKDAGRWCGAKADHKEAEL